MAQLTTRRQHILTGAIAVLVLIGAITVGIKGAFGAFRGGYDLVGTFDAAGQGLLPGSDVKIRGVDVGEVDSIDLVDGAARIRLRMKAGERIPTDATATIRAKTLFGEKFVDLDPGAAEATGPYLSDGDTIADTQGGFELEEVLSDVYPLLQAVDSAELMTVIHELAEGGRGLGESVNRSIVNGAELSRLFADNAELTSRFLTDLAALSGQLADSSQDALGLADAANAALPTLNQNEPAVVDLLRQAGRLSSDVADLLEGNQAFVDASLGDGSRAVQLLFDRQDQVIPLVVGLRQYLQTFAISIRIPDGHGNLMAAVKVVLGGQACGIIQCPGVAPAPERSSTSGSAAPPTTTTPAPPLIDAPTSTTGADDPLGGLFGFLRKVLGA